MLYECFDLPIIIIMKSYTKYTIKTHKIDNKNIDKMELPKPP